MCMCVALQVEQPLGQHHPDVPPFEVDRGDEILDGGDKTLALAEVYAEEGVGVAVVIVGHDTVMSIGLDGETYEILHVEFVVLLLVDGYAQLAAYKFLGAVRRIQIVEADDGTRGAAPFECGAPQRHVERVDLDDFKLYNDVFGHQAGDLALEMFAKVAQQNIRKSDTLVRYGGDEFLIVMPNIPERVLQRKLQLICSQIHDSLIPDYPNMQVSVSIGATIAHDEPISSALERADRLMYRAKTRKNTVVMEHENEQAEEEVPKQKVLIVDDAEMNRAILTEILGNEYEILEAENGRECMQLLQKYRTGISVILLDIVMPVMNGFAVLGEMARQGLIDDIPIIMISSADSDDVIRQAYELGVTDYISRPFDAKIVYRRVVNAIKLYAKQRRLVSMVTKQIVEKEKNDNMLIDILSHIVEFRNTESGLHVLHMKQLTELLLSELLQKTDMYHLDAAKRDLIVTASALHDIGKIAIPEEILNKPGRLTKEEFEIMKTHTTIGSEMLDKIEGYGDEPLVRTAYAICRWHHERYDGHGYPDGLVGEQIPISAQIVALADVYDALVSKRSYKEAFSHETAVHMILNGECGTFNPLILDCLRSAADKIPQIRYDADVCLSRRDKKDAAANEADSAANTKKA